MKTFGISGEKIEVIAKHESLDEEEFVTIKTEKEYYLIFKEKELFSMVKKIELSV